MAFMKRLGYYLLGLSVGLIFLAIFLKNKSEETGTSFCYFPNCRVLKELRSKPIVYAIEQGTSIDSTSVQAFLSSGKVLFMESDTKAFPCPEYVIRQDIAGRTGRLYVENCQDTLRIKAYKPE